MRRPLEIENIEHMRRQEGIHDRELHAAIRRLKIGDLVKITIGIEATAFETVVVRLTRVCGSTFRGKLTDRPRAVGLADLGIGAPIAFTAAHIHSLAGARSP